MVLICQADVSSPKCQCLTELAYWLRSEKSVSAFRLWFFIEADIKAMDNANLQGIEDISI